MGLSESLRVPYHNFPSKQSLENDTKNRGIDRSLLNIRDVSSYLSNRGRE